MGTGSILAPERGRVLPCRPTGTSKWGGFNVEIAATSRPHRRSPTRPHPDFGPRAGLAGAAVPVAPDCRPLATRATAQGISRSGVVTPLRVSRQCRGHAGLQQDRPSGAYTSGIPVPSPDAVDSEIPTYPAFVACP
jgi:hypothetical protein